MNYDDEDGASFHYFYFIFSSSFYNILNNNNNNHNERKLENKHCYRVVPLLTEMSVPFDLSFIKCSCSTFLCFTPSYFTTLIIINNKIK